MQPKNMIFKSMSLYQKKAEKKDEGSERALLTWAFTNEYDKSISSYLNINFLFLSYK